MPALRRAATRLAGLCLVGACLAGTWAMEACRGDGPDAAGCAEALPPLPQGFGAPGPYPVMRQRVANPEWPGLDVSVFLPEGATGRVPLVVFGHANDVADPDHYAALIEHVVGRGNALVFAPYMVGTAVHAQRYAALLAGVKAAADAFAERLDTSRVGFVGHSYGAGAMPYVARHAARAWGWGAEGRFVHLMAPWFALDPGAGDSPPQLPPGTLLLVQVFEDDTANDHRIAIDLLGRLGVAEADRDYVLVRSERWRGCELPAVHTVPQSRGLRARDDALDERAVFRLLDALAAAAFANDPAGRRVALGHGAPEQTDLGRWPDGTPLRPLVAGLDPKPSHEPAHYLFRQSEAEGWRRYGAEGAGG